MSEIKMKNNKIKLILLTIVLIALIPMIIVLNSIATEFELENVANIEDNVGAVVASYSTPYKTTQGSFEGYFNDTPFTALATDTAVYCLWHGKALFNQHDRCTLNRIYNPDIDMDNEISFPEYGADFSPKTHTFPDFMERTDGSGATTESNIRYKVSATDLRNISTNSGSWSGNIIPYAVTFAQGVKPWTSEIAQLAIWQKTSGNGSENDLYKAGHCVDDLEEQIGIHGETPTVKAIQKSADVGCGTILEGDNYVVGPFEMNDYAYVASSYVEGYSGKNLTIQKDLVGGIASGFITLNNGIQLEFGKQVTIRYTKNGDNSRSGTYWTTPKDYTCPYPNSEFYLVFPRSATGNATTLNTLTFQYRKTRASGTGFVANGEYIRTEFTKENVQKSSCSYSATCSGGYTDTKDDGGTYSMPAHSHSGCSCGGHHCDGHGHNSTCTPECTSEHKCSGCIPDCNGNHTCSATYTCTHGYQHCESFNWKGTSSKEIPQPMLAVEESLVEVTEDPIVSTVNVRLTTDLTINKYIVKVEHIGENYSIFDNTTQRSREANAGMTKAWKNSNPVPAERGDRVTYYIDIINKQDQKVSCKIQDTYPSASDQRTLKLQANGSDVTPDTWIIVEGNSITRIIATLVTTSDSGKWENNVKIITNNMGTPDYNRTEYTPGDNRHHGPVVNVAEIEGRELEDSDYYVIKEYNVSIEKYVYDVKHNPDVNLSTVGRGLNTVPITNSKERDRQSLGGGAEGTKKSNPVYVEYGDIVTYKIVVYNTTGNTGTDFDVGRGGAPYWEPDKVYVNLADSLPRKYSGLSVTVEGAPSGVVPNATNAGESNHSTSISSTSSNSGGSFTITDLMVPAGQTRTITVTLKVEEYEKGTIEENNVRFEPDTMRNINKGPSGRAADQYCVIKNNSASANRNTSDWYILNNYNTFTDKYVYKYFEEMQILNEQNGYSQGGYVSNEDGVLIKSRRNDITGTQNVTDKHGMVDTVKIVDNKETYKKNYPVSVEKTETIVYRIAVTNEAKEANTVNSISSGRKPATQVRTSTITDHMEVGLNFIDVKAAIYRDVDGKNKIKDVSVGSNLKGQENKNGRTYNVYEYTVGNESIVNPGETIIYEVTVKIGQSNMYLLDLENNATLTRLTNINNTNREKRDIKNPSYNEDISPQDKKGSSEFVRMKDLVIGGYVWVDFDKNGLKDDVIRDASDKAYYNLDDKAMKRDVVVKLYRVNGDNGDLIRTTKTNENGFYTFGKGSDDAFAWRTGDYNYAEGLPNSDTYKAGSNFDLDYYQRVEKATNKDDYGNYQVGSELIKYYIEFEYDGVVFKSTEFYSGMDNIDKNTNSSGYGAAINQYKVPGDSNAYEFTDVRETFNTKYEYITYDKAYDLSQTTGTSLAFDKTNHTSQLIDDPSRTITARTFIKADTIQGRYDSSHSDWNPQPCTSSIANTNTLWLFDFGSSANNNETPETEYLKDVNLGLELREDVDIALTKDVYSVRTTINGEQMEYFYNQNNGLNGEIKSEEGKYLKDFIVKTPYGLDLYESDYKMRVEQYKSNAVKAYKGVNGESELNVEVTYRISVANKAINDDETLPRDKTKDTKLKIKVGEIVDFYDTNFKKVFENGVMGEAVKTKLANSQGYLEDATIKLAEAWYFKEDPTGDYVIGEGSFPSIYEKDSNKTSANKPVFVKADSTSITDGPRYKKFYLNLSATSKLGDGNSEKENSNNFTADGYNTLYISGMENDSDLDIAEGRDIDIYIKYVLDKAELEVTNENEDFSDTTQESFYLNDADKTKVNVVINTTGTTSKIQRSLKLADYLGKQADTERGIEGISQVNLYSVWYEDGKPTSLVDMDSNAGNIGNTNDGLVDKLKDVADTQTRKGIVDAAKASKVYTSSDAWEPYYEDMTYKTGIEITADGTEWTKNQAKNLHGGLEIQEEKTIRELTGMVWDDSRTESDGGDSLSSQYSADGIYNPDITKDNDALTNDNVPTNYENDKAAKEKETPDEEQDIKVRNAKAELVEIVEIPQAGGQPSHYYEEVLRNVTWNQAQHIRTKTNGNYTLKGFIPGKYVVRFTYGDTVDTLTSAEQNYSETAQIQYVTKDMQVFNGQDYKTTKYAYDLSTDYLTESGSVANVPVSEGTIDTYAARHNSTVGAISDNDVVMTALERPDLSDARDDEIRRLEVNNYSEIMVNEKAEVLKGLANSTGLSETRLDGEGTDKGLSIDYYKYFKNAEYESEKNAYLTELTDNTYMEAETVEFLVKPEKLTNEQTTQETYYMKLSGNKDYYYNNLDTIVNKIITQRKYKIENIDMGVEYRPETNISLTKEIDTIQLVTSDNEVLVDLKLKTKLENGKTVHYVDMENSMGAENVQIVSNTYDIDPLLKGIVDVYEEQRQGFIYVAVDDDILQGCKVVITYKFTAQNNSEVDRISNRINEIRFYGNNKTTELKDGNGTTNGYINTYRDKAFTIDNVKKGFDVLNRIKTYGTDGEETDGTEYTANNFAKNMVKFDVYTEDDDNITYRNRAKTMILDEINGISDSDGSNGYFGKYVGYTYYVGNNANATDKIKENKQNLDTISELKFDVVIDYVDTNLEFEQVSQSTGVKFTEVGSNGGNGNNLDSALTGENNIVNQFGIENQNWSNTSTLPVTNLSRYLFKLSSPWSELTSALKEAGTQEPTPGGENPIFTTLQSAADMLKDIQGVKYKSLVMTVSDKQSDEDTKNNNDLFSRFLQPRVVKEEESMATVYLPVSKLLATETDTDEMLYENIAEVSQFTVLTGRRTNFDTTIGNVDIHEVLKQNESNPNDDPYDKYGSIEYVTAALETDTSSTETITLTPPTGLMRNRRAIYEAIDTTTDVVEITVIAVAVIILVVVVTKVTITKIRKRRYK